MAEMEHFMQQTGKEQKFRLQDRVPTVEEYWEFRQGASAVGVIVAVQE